MAKKMAYAANKVVFSLRAPTHPVNPEEKNLYSTKLFMAN